jgi:hypothetical protein
VAVQVSAPGSAKEPLPVKACPRRAVASGPALTAGTTLATALKVVCRVPTLASVSVAVATTV